MDTFCCNAQTIIVDMNVVDVNATTRNKIIEKHVFNDI
jgi:hypothetical protein